MVFSGQDRGDNSFLLLALLFLTLEAKTFLFLLLIERRGAINVRNVVSKRHKRVYGYLLLLVVNKFNQFWVDTFKGDFGAHVHRDLEQLPAHVPAQLPAQILTHFLNEPAKLLQEPLRTLERVVLGESAH